MLTYKKVMDAFNEYFSIDNDVEVVITSRGYAVIAWDEKSKEFTDFTHC